MLLEFTFEEKIMGQRNVPHVIVRHAGQPWGDPINDNAYEEDFYRYHDVFHFGMYGITGCSPVVEYFLGNGYDVCGCEQEEGLSAVLFGLGKHHNYFQTVPPSETITRHLLMATARQTSFASLAHMKADDWHRILKEIYRIHWQMVETRGGKLLVEKARCFEYLPL